MCSDNLFKSLIYHNSQLIFMPKYHTVGLLIRILAFFILRYFDPVFLHKFLSIFHQQIFPWIICIHSDYFYKNHQKCNFSLKQKIILSKWYNVKNKKDYIWILILTVNEKYKKSSTLSKFFHGNTWKTSLFGGLWQT